MGTERVRMQLANRFIIAGVTSALVFGGTGTLFVPPPHLTTREVTLTAAIDESSSTLGFANSNMYQLSTSDIDQELELMEQLGVTNVRISVAWASIEAREGQYNWDAIDYVVNAAAQRNMGILGVLSETPEWAGTPYLAGMPDPDVYAEFAQLVATRYQDKISAYEIWNEPNAINSLNPVDPAAYTTLLQAAYPAIKAVDPSITVIGGVLGSGLSHQNVAMNPVDFLTGMYAAGAKGNFDALSFHPYDYTLDFSSGATQPGSPLKQLQQLMAIMAQNGDGDLKIWATEYGEPTTSQHSEQQQYDFIQDFLESWPEIAGTGPMFIYTLRDPDSGNPNQQDNLGLYYTNWDPKQAVQAIIEYLASNPGTGEPLPPDHPIIAAIKSAVAWLGAATRTVIKGAATAVVDIADVAVNAAKTLAHATVQVIDAVANATVAAVKGAVQLAAAVAKGIVQAAANALTNGANFVRNIAHNISAAIGEIGSRAAVSPALRTADMSVADADSDDAESSGSEALSPQVSTVAEPATEGSAPSGPGVDAVDVDVDLGVAEEDAEDVRGQLDDAPVPARKAPLSGRKSPLSVSKQAGDPRDAAESVASDTDSSEAESAAEGNGTSAAA